MIELDPEIAEAFRASTAVSGKCMHFYLERLFFLNSTYLLPDLILLSFGIVNKGI